MDETQGFLYLGHSNWTICSLLSWFCLQIFPSSWSLYWGVQFLITPESEVKKKDSPKTGRDTGVSVFGAFKLDHLKPVKLLMCQNISRFLTFILGAPISYYPRERKRGSSMGWKWEKGIHPKVNETQGFQYLGYSNWTICSLLSWFCSNIFPPSWPLYWGLPFLITPERGWKEGAGAENGEKENLQKRMRHRG